MRQIKKGSTDQSVVIRIVDSTTGQPETSVEHDSGGIDLWYRREGATKTSITEAALAALDTAHTDGGIEHIGDGYYRLDPPDAAFATGANGVAFGGTVTGMVVIGCYVPLVDYDPQDTVRLGLTALPNAAADGAGGLPISDAGGLDLDAQVGTKINEILTDTAEIGAAGAGLTEAGGTGDHLTAVPWNASWDAEVQSEVDDALIAKGLDHLVFTSVTGTDIADNSIIAKLVSKSATADWDSFVNTTDALEALRDRGDAAWITATGFSTHSAADVWAVGTRVLTAGTNIDGSTFTAIPWNASWDAEVQSEVQDAIEANHLDHFIAVADPGGVVANSSFLAKLVSKSATPAFSSYDNTTDSLEANRDNIGTAGAGLTAADDAVISAIATAQADLDIITGADGATVSSASKTEIQAGLATTVNVAAVETDTQDIQARLPAALTGAGNIKSDALAVSGSTTAADRLELSALEILPGTIDNTVHSPTTTEFEADDITEATADHFNGRIIIFTSGALQYQATSISDYSLVSGRGHFTVVALTEAPSNDGTFIII